MLIENIEKEKPNLNLNFPKGFLWGASTSSHQVEGNNINDWSEWEKSEKRLKYLQRKGLLKKYGLVNFISGRAVDHYSRFKEDFKIAKELGHNATRFSIEWSRIEPEKGKFNEKEIDHYREVLLYLKDLKIEPFVTLWHFTNPLWLAKEGGWQNEKAVFYFERYVKKIVEELGNLVNFWITLNEPEIYCFQSYLIGRWPPQKISICSFWKVLHNLEKAHKKAYQAIKEKSFSFQVGIAKNNTYFETYKNKIAHFILKKPADYFCNFYFLNKIKQHQDFIGLNYYFHRKIFLSFKKEKGEKFSDLGWRLSPYGIYYALKDLKKYNKPIYITENGLADKEDKYRGWFILETLNGVREALNEGINVKGYFHWALTDNFEWNEGFWPRFGLVEVDYQTLERKIRPSAFLYKQIIEKSCF